MRLCGTREIIFVITIQYLRLFETVLNFFSTRLKYERNHRIIFVRWGWEDLDVNWEGLDVKYHRQRGMFLRRLKWKERSRDDGSGTIPDGVEVP